MRVTMNAVYANILTNLGSITQDMNRINQQISSGKQMSTISDNPVGLVSVLGLRTTIAEISQYQRNLTFGDTVIKASENALSQMQDMVMRAKTLAIQQANATMTPENRANAALEIRHLWEQAIILANSSVHGKHIFGGFRTSGYTPAEPAPFVQGARDGYFINGGPVSDQPLTGNLRINGQPVTSAAASAAAKAAAINNGQFGVRAEITPAVVLAQGSVQTDSIGLDDLRINGISIFATPPTTIEVGDVNNALVRAINNQTKSTGITASRDSSGRLLLSAVDGRNLHIVTSARGESVTRLNNTGGIATNQVYFGSVRLLSDQPFSLEDTDSRGFAALGISGGGSNQLQVNTIYHDNDQVRYAGDRVNNIEIKVGRQSTIEVSKNGFAAIFDSGIFQALKGLEHALLGQKFTTATGAVQAANLNVALNSGATGLALADRIQAGGGEFTVTVTSHDFAPPTSTSTTIRVNPANDSLTDISQRLHGISGLEARWTADGYLQLQSSDPQRFSFELNRDSSGLLVATGLTPNNVQVSSINHSMDELDSLLNALSNHISDFGARANRIEVQSNIYRNLTLATTENLSTLEDTDLVQAIMELKARETAHQAALGVAARTMQLSLVDFL
ncbi:MAG: hypothetical protein EYX74_07400 [Desulfobulbaceae bacterium]|nr:MAG: hypothetical protein EYX74_07400 [Desulfobulbaceae bacterium]